MLTFKSSIGLGGVNSHHGFNVNTWVPCPASGRLARHSGIDCWPVEIVQQRLTEDGTLWTVLRCGWCGMKYRIDRTEAEALAVFLRSTNATRRVPTAATGTPSRIASSPATRARRWS